MDPRLRQRERETKKKTSYRSPYPQKKEKIKIFANDDNGDDYDANLLRKKSKRDVAGKDFPRARERERERDESVNLDIARTRPSVVST